MKILFIGDIVGKPGRETIKELLPKLIRQHKIDLVIANSENAAHGKGINPDILKELQTAGVDIFSGGDHSFDDKQSINVVYGGNYPIVRPANYSANVPGSGYFIIKKDGKKILLISLIGRVFMKMDYDCPFRELDNILANLAKQKFSAIIIDIHAEATSEKNAMFHYANSRVSAVLGTHTHVMTADEQISLEGTAYITDVGMVGYNEGCIGIKKEEVLKTFFSQIRETHEIPESGRCILNAVLLNIDSKTAQTKKITPIKKYFTIK